MCQLLQWTLPHDKLISGTCRSDGLQCGTTVAVYLILFYQSVADFVNTIIFKKEKNNNER